MGVRSCDCVAFKCWAPGWTGGEGWRVRRRGKGQLGGGRPAPDAKPQRTEEAPVGKWGGLRTAAGTSCEGRGGVVLLNAWVTISLQAVEGGATGVSLEPRGGWAGGVGGALCTGATGQALGCRGVAAGLRDGAGVPTVHLERPPLLAFAGPAMAGGRPHLKRSFSIIPCFVFVEVRTSGPFPEGTHLSSHEK